MGGHCGHHCALVTPPAPRAPAPSPAPSPLRAAPRHGR
eukprot:gene21059-61571_t